MPHHRASFIAILALIGSITTACTNPLVREINRRWPPVNHHDHQLTAVREAAAGVAAMDRAEAYMGVSSTDLQSLLPTVLQTAVPEIISCRVRIGTQELVADVDFDLIIEEIGATVEGEATIHAALALAGSEVVIHPAASQLRVRRLDFARKPEVPGPALAVVNAALDRFLENLNGAIEEQRIKLAFSESITLTPSSLLSGLPDLEELSGRDIVVPTTFARGAVLVDSAGLHVLADLQPSALVVKSIAHTPTALGAGDLIDAHRELAHVFKKRAIETVGDVEEIWPSSAVAVSREFLADLLNGALANPELCARFTLAGFEQDFNELLHLDPAPDLKCEENAAQRSCSIDQECSQSRDCNPHWNCRSCNGWDAANPICHAERAGCEADKVRYRAQCEIEKKAAKDGCEIDKERRRLSCEAEKALRKAECMANQAWLTAWSGANIGRIRGHAALERVDAALCLRSLAVSNDLSEISAVATLQASGNLTSSFVYTPLDAGHIACVAQWGGSLRAQVGVPDVAAELRAKLITSGSGRSLAFETEPVTVPLKMVPPPIVAVLRDNPHAAVVCAPAAALGLHGVALSPKLREDMLTDAFEGRLPAQRLEIPLDAIALTVAGQELSLTPAIDERSIRLTVHHNTP